jgi:16S rRNA (uracil1498-N3)-methyltransferase
VNEVLRRSAAHLVVDDVDVPAPTDDERHHLQRALRLRAGAAVTVTDGQGRWRPCTWTGDRLEPSGPTDSVDSPPMPSTLAFAIPKADRPEWIVQKATELRISRIVLLHADRSVVRWDGPKGAKQLDRLRSVARAALSQSRGCWLPSVEGPVDAVAVLPTMVAAEPGGRPRTVADRAVAIGPEGGWSDRELTAAADRIDLGASVLRVETAALTVCALLWTASDHGA